MSTFTLTLAAFVTLLPSLSTMQTREGPRSTRVADVSTITILNFGQVNASYYRGGELKAGDYAALAALGIRTVIALRPAERNDQEARLVEAAGMTFHRIAMDSNVAPALEHVAEFMTIVSDPRSPAGLRPLHRRQAPHRRHDGGLPDGA